MQDHTLQHLLEGAYRMFKLFRGSYAYITESKGLEGLKIQLSQFYDKVPTTSATLEALKGLLYVGVPFPGMVSMATRKEAVGVAPLCGPKCPSNHSRWLCPLCGCVCVEGLVMPHYN